MTTRKATASATEREVAHCNPSDRWKVQQLTEALAAQ